MKITEQAPAKVNLTLSVGERRPDGYHDLESVMTSVGLFDTVALEQTDTGAVTMTCTEPGLACDETNLCVRAARLFLKETGTPCSGLAISLEKRIPMQAGLGGGSSDAAAVLRGLRRMYAPEVPVVSLEKWAISLGSDVPYCVRGATTLVRGKGERLLKLPKLPLCWFVLCKPQLSLSTAHMYGELDRLGVPCAADNTDLMSGLEAGDLRAVTQRLSNHFEAVLPPDSPIFSIRRRLLALGAAGACMSGSGSAVFGLFTQEETARRAAQELSADYSDTFFAERV